MVNRPTRWDSEVWTAANSAPVQTRVPPTVAEPVPLLKAAKRFTVMSTVGGAGMTSMVRLSVPPLPAPSAWSSKTRIAYVVPAVAAQPTAPGPHATRLQLPGLPVATITPAEYVDEDTSAARPPSATAVTSYQTLASVAGAPHSTLTSLSLLSVPA